MLKKSITYTDLNDNEVTEDFYFHLSQAELIEMEMSHQGGLKSWLEKIVASGDGAAIMAEMKKMILSAYGQRSDDGKRFVKSDALREEFVSSEAYSELFMELCTKDGAAATFVNGIVPQKLSDQLAKASGREFAGPHPSDPEAKPVGGRNVFENNVEADPTAVDPEPRWLTRAELIEMDSAELKAGIADGRYKLQ